MEYPWYHCFFFSRLRRPCLAPPTFKISKTQCFSNPQNSAPSQHWTFDLGICRIPIFKFDQSPSTQTVGFMALCLIRFHRIVKKGKYINSPVRLRRCSFSPAALSLGFKTQDFKNAVFFNPESPPPPQLESRQQD